MGSRFRPRLSYANVMSTIAVFAVLGGGAYAQSRIGTNDIQNRAITKQKLAKGAVGTAKVERRAIGTGKIKQNAVGIGKMKDGSVGPDQLLNGSVGELQLQDDAVSTLKLQNDAVTTEKLAPAAVGHGKIADGAVIASKLGNIVTRTDSVAVPPGNVNTQIRSVTANCGPGEVLISGGGGFTVNLVADLLRLVHSRKVGNGWQVRAESNSGAQRTLRAEAYCLTQ